MANQPEIAVVEVDVEVAKTEEIAPKKRAKPATAKYEVINGAISPYGGGMETLIQPGSVVELPTDLAVQSNKLGYLKPYIEE
jgi:hypothetical protein